MAGKKKNAAGAGKKKYNKAEVAVPGRKDALYLICGLLSLSVAVITLVSLISYLYTWADDQSLFSNNDILSALVDTENGGGKLGLVLSNFLVSKLFGLGAFVIPFFFGGVALFCLKIKRVRLLRLFFISLFGCIIISVLFSYIFSFTSFDNWFGGGAGGSYGYYVNEWLKGMVGNIGAGAIIAVALIAWLITIDNRLIVKINNWIDRIASVRFPVRKRKADTADGEMQEDLETSGSEGVPARENEAGDMLQNSTVFTVEDIDTPGVDPEEGIVDVSENGGTEGKTAADELEIEVISEAEKPAENNSGTEKESEPKQENEDFLSAYSDEELQRMFDPRLDLSSYQAPPLTLLEDYRDKWYEVSRAELENNKARIVNTLANYKIGITKVSVRIGPTVTLYEVVPAPGVRVAQIKKLEADIQRSLAARGVRVVTLPGSNAVGIEVANEKPSVVSMLSVLDDARFKETKYDLPIALGKTITGEVFTFDLAKMPHLLVAGATGQGKSVGLNAILTSLLYSKHPSELKLVLVDPKKVEFSLYSKLEHHFFAQLPDADEPVITDTQKVIYTLKSLCKEMDSRYDLLKIAGVRNIKEYNEKFLQRRLNPLKGHRFLPYIVLIIDEFGDLVLTAGREIEEPITRLAQLARAIGIHLVIATQRPTTTVITGNIKANFPARIAFMVRSSMDSKVILDEVGANQLIGRGDMLISTGGDLVRMQCAYIDTKEVERVVDFISSQRGYTTPYYLPEYTGEDDGEGETAVGVVDLNKRDSLFEEAAKLIVIHQQGSTSLIQRKMNLGYNRAGRIMDQLEVAGIVGPSEGSKARQVLVQDLTELDGRLANIKSIYG